MNARLLLGLTVLASGCSAPSLWVIPRLSLTEVDGDVASVANGVGGVPGALAGSASLQNDLLLDDTNSDFAPRVDVKMGPHISVSFLDSSFEGIGGTLPIAFDDGTNQIAANAVVNSNLDVSATNVAFTWDFVPGDIEVGLGLGVSLIDFVLDITDGVNTFSTADDGENIPVPMLAARAGIDKEDFQVGLLVAGLSVDSDIISGDSDEQFDLTTFDIDLHGAYKIFSGAKVRGMVVVGFRQFSFDFEGNDADNTVDFDLDFGGPYFGVNLAL